LGNRFSELFPEADAAGKYQGLKIRWKRFAPRGQRFLPFSTVIASMDFKPSAMSAEWRIFNPELWKANFKVGPPDLNKIIEEYLRAHEEAYFDMMVLALLVFEDIENVKI